MVSSFIRMLDEPKNTLGRTEEVVEMVLEKPELIEDLYQCYLELSDDWIVQNCCSLIR